MTQLMVAFSSESKKVTVMAEGEDAPDGQVITGQFGVDDTESPSKFNQALVNEVREILYQAGWQDMQSVQIAVTPLAYDVVNQQFLPNLPKSVEGNQPVVPAQATDDNPETSAQANAVKKARKKKTAPTEETAVPEEGITDRIESEYEPREGDARE